MEANKKSQPDSGEAWTTKEFVIAAGTGTAVGIATIYGAPVVVGVILKGVGFGTAGVATGSVAAGIQSTVGNIAAGSVFSLCQSAGAAGIGSITATCVGAVSGATTATVVFAKRLGYSVSSATPVEECDDNVKLKSKL